MQGHTKYLLLFGLLFGCGLARPLAAKADACATCGREFGGHFTYYTLNDKVTNEGKIVCSDCIKLPRCSICGLPVAAKGLELPDGRHLCARDARTVVLKVDEAQQVCARVKDDLDRLFSRFTVFPTNVEVEVIDRIDVDAMFRLPDNAFESPNLLGCLQSEVVNNVVRYKIRLMTGLPLAELKETCAHEYSHAWVKENVSPERRGKLGRDAEEGFCEMVAYRLMDSQQEAGEKQRILQNRYTRGQIDLFLEAEKRYGFDQVLDWMKYGVAGQLEAGHVEQLRDVKMPSAKSVPRAPVASGPTNKPAPLPAPATIKLDGIMWSSRPVAIINGRSFLAHDLNPVKVGNTNMMIRCLGIQKTSVRIQNAASGKEQELRLSDN
jgi:hypothetical protein